MKRLINAILAALMAVATLLFTLSASILGNSYYLPYFRGQMEANGIEAVTGRSMDDLLRLSRNLISYLQTGRDAVLETDFARHEILHMQDVYQLYRAATIICIITGIACLILGYLIFIRHRRTSDGQQRLRYLTRSMTVYYILIAMVTIACLINFYAMFMLFHEIFFTNDLYLLDPRTDLLIQLLPEQFFARISLRILLWHLAGYTAVWGLTLILSKRRRMIKS
ncbi:MAG: TIGR01906 family membrane protein [Lachnospiraceae bacterium]|nr:TIGR01906 family membrane protein [Lachnospiraceae bacterium]MDY5741455.1 TIGR01906 family membrane protein [Lachnospiraceae bacterium]